VDLAADGGPEQLFREATERFGAVDVLINNAGVGYAGSCLSIPNEADEKLIALNDTAAVLLCKLFGRQMAARQEGLIINLGSTGAFQPGPGIASYYASKAFIVSYSQALAYELRASGVRVQCFCPGPVDTSFYEKSGGIRPGVDLMKPQDAARWLYAHRDSRKVVLVPGALNRIGLALPVGLRMRIVALLKERNAGKGRK
jgi:short-subunit dehydrogenase